MFRYDGNFFKPGRETRTLAILDHLAQDSGLSQNELGRRMNLSSAMINQYLHQLHAQSLVEFEAVNGKSYRYVLTPQGEQKRRRLFSDYSSETVQIYTALKNFIVDKLSDLRQKRMTKLALFGASETCEVALSAIKDSCFEVLTLFDNDPAKQGTLFHGYVVSPPEVLGTIQCQAVLITSFGGQDDIYRQIRPLCQEKGIHIVKL